MGTLADMNRRVQALSLTDLAAAIIAQNATELADIQRKQLMQGKNNEGDLLGPRHSENPFFKSPESALRYARWKQKITPETPFDVPNLYINGQYHGGIFIKVAGDKVTTDSKSPLAGKINNTFKGKQLGLNSDSKVTAFKDHIRSPLVKAVASQLQVNTV